MGRRRPRRRRAIACDRASSAGGSVSHGGAVIRTLRELRRSLNAALS